MTTGTKLAAEVRQKMNGATRAERKRLFTLGLKLIHEAGSNKKQSQRGWVMDPDGIRRNK